MIKYSNANEEIIENGKIKIVNPKTGNFEKKGHDKIKEDLKNIFDESDRLK